MTEKLLFVIIVLLVAGFKTFKRIRKTNREQFDISSLAPLGISIFVILFVVEKDIFSSRNRFDEWNDKDFRIENNIPPIETDMFLWHNRSYEIRFITNLDDTNAIHFMKEINYDLFSKSKELDWFHNTSNNLVIETTFPSLFRKFNQEYYLYHIDKETPMREIVTPISKLSADSILKTKGIILFNNSN